MWQLAIPICLFAFCYGRIFHSIRRQSNVVTSHAGRNQAATTTATASGHVQQPATGDAAGNRLSRTELNILQTMTIVVACFTICWTVPAIVNALTLLGVSDNCYRPSMVACAIDNLHLILPRCMECRRGLAMRILSVCLYVCPSVCQTRAL